MPEQLGKVADTEPLGCPVEKEGPDEENQLSTRKPQKACPSPTQQIRGSCREPRVVPPGSGGGDWAGLGWDSSVTRDTGYLMGLRTLTGPSCPKCH